MNDDFVTVQEAAAILRVSEDTIWRMCQDGDLIARKVRRQWRIDASEVRSSPPRYAKPDTNRREPPPIR